eukprot:m.170496 g.170496  ORF g.170496 m.170496 type:complete len:536 (+) comp24207_c0_seq3:1852-3459(+)
MDDLYCRCELAAWCPESSFNSRRSRLISRSHVCDSVCPKLKPTRNSASALLPQWTTVTLPTHCTATAHHPHCDSTHHRVMSTGPADDGAVTAAAQPALYLLDYGGGNVRSVINAIKAAGCTSLKLIESVDDFAKADKIIFPGVGAFGFCISRLTELGFLEPLREYVLSGKPFFGVCIGMQCLFEGSEEAPGMAGLGIVPGMVRRFQVRDKGLAVPEMGWNGINVRKHSSIVQPGTSQRYYFVHSFIAPPTPENSDWILTTTNYGEEFISSIQKGNVLATQFHPEKSGEAGIDVYRRFIFSDTMTPSAEECAAMTIDPNPAPTALAPRVIACLDVRSNDDGDLVVTKGDQYDVREKTDGRGVRNLGKPVILAEQYYKDGADEITFLNITSFRNSPLKDQPMLDVLRAASERVFVPLTIGGGIRSFEDSDGVHRSALDVASAYFRSGADKVSIGSDAVLIAEEYIKTGVKTGTWVVPPWRTHSSQVDILALGVAWWTHCWSDVSPHQVDHRSDLRSVRRAGSSDLSGPAQGVRDIAR